MTVAVCPECGSFKHGALTPCADCEYQPESSVDQATAIFLTDHYHSRGEFEEFAGRIRGGEEISAP